MKHDFSHLGLSLAFSAAYLNGAMANEHPEIRKHWETIRDFLLKHRPIADIRDVGIPHLRETPR